MNMAHSVIEMHIVGADKTECLGELIARISVPGDVIALHGQLGSGKSTLVRGILKHFGLAGSAASPTFNIAHVYPTDPPIYHIDAYRFKHEYEFEDTGYAEEIGEDNIFIIEWAERMQGYLPDERIDILLEHAENGRHVSITFTASNHRDRFSRLQELLRNANLY